MAEQNLQALALEIVDRAKKAGAQDAFVNVGRSRQVELQRRDGATERLVESTAQSVSVQLWVDGRYSSQSSTDLRPERLDSFLGEAVALTRALQPDPLRLIPDASVYAKELPNVDLADPTLVAGLPALEQARWVEGMEAEARKHERVISVTSNLRYDSSSGACASSAGFAGDSTSTSIWPSVEVTLRDDGDRRAQDGDYFGARYLSDLPDPAKIGKKALEMTLLRLGARPVDTRRTTLVVDPHAAGSIVARLLAPATASAVQQKRSFLAGSMGKSIASAKLTLVDDPLLPRGLGSRRFDGEGLPARRLPVVTDGVLQSFYVDTYYGRKAGLAPTTGSASNRVLTLGDQDLAAWMAQVGTGILVTSWMGGNADNNSGDFSFGIRGHLIEGGKVGAPIGEMNVTGNLVALFQSLVGVGNDPWLAGGTRAPTLVFENVQFSGV